MVLRGPVVEPPIVGVSLDDPAADLANLRRARVEHGVVHHVRPQERDLGGLHLIPAPGVVGVLGPVAEHRLEMTATRRDGAELVSHARPEGLERCALLDRPVNLLKDRLHGPELEKPRDPEGVASRSVLCDPCIDVGNAPLKPGESLLEAPYVGCDAPCHA